MTPGLSYALITPARDEAENLTALAATVVHQTLLPAAWVIVDDGSADATPRVAAELAREHPWIMLVQTERDREGIREGRREGRDLLSIQEGLQALVVPADLVTKLDADVTLPLDYFERLVAAFAADTRLGIASGTRSELVHGRWEARHLTGSTVAAQCRTFRRACWDEVQPLEPRMGWDGIDEIRAVLAGWRTLVVQGLIFRHHRPRGCRDGSRFRARAAEGAAAHYMGYRPYYLVLRSLWHARREVSALGMLWGWAAAAAGRHARYDDVAARAYLRRQQSASHIGLRAREARGCPSADTASRSASEAIRPRSRWA